VAGGEIVVTNEEKIITTTVRLPESMNHEISKIAESEHRSINSMLLKMFDDFIKAKKEACK
jgi:predicted transcriptional regulator